MVLHMSDWFNPIKSVVDVNASHNWIDLFRFHVHSQTLSRTVIALKICCTCKELLLLEKLVPCLSN